MRHDETCGPETGRLEGDTGGNLVEYALLLSLILIVCLSALTLFGSNATEKISCVSSAVSSEIGGIDC